MTTTITFQDYPDGTIISTQYAGVGVPLIEDVSGYSYDLTIGIITYGPPFIVPTPTAPPNGPLMLQFAHSGGAFGGPTFRIHFSPAVWMVTIKYTLTTFAAIIGQTVGYQTGFPSTPLAAFSWGADPVFGPFDPLNSVVTPLQVGTLMSCATPMDYVDVQYLGFQAGYMFMNELAFGACPTVARGRAWIMD